VAAERVGPGGQVLAVDLLEMEPVSGVDVSLGDFTEPDVRDGLLAKLPAQRARLVMSDMAPNLTGVRDADQARAAELGLRVLEFASEALAVDGAVLLKVFQGGSMQDVVNEARRRFRRVKVKKPQASRARSAETYLLGRDGIF